MFQHNLSYKRVYDAQTTCQRQASTASGLFRLSGVPCRWLQRTVLFILSLLLLSCVLFVQVLATDGSTPPQVSRTLLVVAQGDTLWTIAEREKPVGVDTRYYIYIVQQLNGLHNGHLQIGQILELPTAAELE